MSTPKILPDASFEGCAHPAGNDGVSIVANVRTKVQKPPKDASIEIKVPLATKMEVQAKSRREGKTMSQIIRQALEDYLAGSLYAKRQRFGNSARRMQAAEIRQRQIMIDNQLRDLGQIAINEPNGPLKTAACEDLLASILIQNDNLFTMLL